MNAVCFKNYKTESVLIDLINQTLQCITECKKERSVSSIRDQCENLRPLFRPSVFYIPRSAKMSLAMATAMERLLILTYCIPRLQKKYRGLKYLPVHIELYPRSTLQVRVKDSNTKKIIQLYYQSEQL